MSITWNCKEPAFPSVEPDRQAIEIARAKLGSTAGAHEVLTLAQTIKTTLLTPSKQTK